MKKRQKKKRIKKTIEMMAELIYQDRKFTNYLDKVGDYFLDNLKKENV